MSPIDQASLLRVSEERCPVETGGVLLLLRDRLTFVLRDGAATHAAADTPTLQRALLPCALPKQQVRPPWAQTGLVASVCEELS
jgi:hypothetical protein